MKKVLSLILALVMLFAAVPFAANAAQPDAADTGDTAGIRNVNWYFDEYNNLQISWYGVENTKEYEVSLSNGHGELANRRVTVYDESHNSGLFNCTFPYSVFTEVMRAEYAGNQVSFRIIARNQKGSIITQTRRSGISAAFLQYLGRSYGSFYGDGVFCFSAVEHAAAYEIRLERGGHHHLATAYATTDRYADFSDYLTEGLTYYVYVWPYASEAEKDDYIQTYSLIEEWSFSKESKIGGNVFVNDDRSVSYSGFIDYLVHETDTDVTLKWEAYEKGKWFRITEEQKVKYDASFLRVTVTADGYTGSLTSADNTWTNSEYPYFASDIEGLKSVFNQNRSNSRKTVYIKLSADIEYNSKNIRLATCGANVDLDLCGHSLFGFNPDTPAYADDALICGSNGAVIIHDTPRYDEEKGIWLYGTIVGNFAPDKKSTAVLKEEIVLESGTIINLSHSEDGSVRHHVYTGAKLKMYGGSMTADIPIDITYGYEGCGIFGGTLYVRGSRAIRIRDNEYEPCVPTIKNVEMYNMSGSDNTLSYTISFEHDDIASWAMQRLESYFAPGTNVYLNDVLQTSVTDGAVYYDSSKTLDGPRFGASYKLSSLRIINNLELTVPEPNDGEPVVYDASSPNGAFYSRWKYTDGVMWKNGVMWYDSQGPLDPQFDNHFIPGETYTVYVQVVANSPTLFRFAAAKDLAVTFNGHKASVTTYNPSLITVSYTFAAETTWIDTLSVYIPTPKAGYAITYDAYAPFGSGYQVKEKLSDGTRWKTGVQWDHDGDLLNPQDNNVFEVGETYTVTVSLELTDEKRFEFAPWMSMTAFVNDRWANDFDKISDNNYVVRYTFTLTSTSGVIVGDADGDGEITILDATAIQRYLAELPTKAYVEPAADADEDGSVAIVDATAIQRHLADLPANKNIGKPKK